MKNNSKLIIGTALFVAIIFAGAYSFSSAYQGDGEVGPNYSQERHEAMEKAFENNDYAAWKELMSDMPGRRVTDVINEDNFSQFAEAHKLTEEGKYDEAKKIRSDLGLGLGMKNGNNEGRGQGRGNCPNN